MYACRPEASKEGIKKAKAAVKKAIIRTVHPLIQGCDGVRCNSLLAEKAVCMYCMYVCIYIHIYKVCLYVYTHKQSMLVCIELV